MNHARVDCRAHLMRSRHRISKLLLLQGIVYAGGQAWTGQHRIWVNQQHPDEPAPGADLPVLSGRDAGHKMDAATIRIPPKKPWLWTVNSPLWSSAWAACAAFPP